MKIRIANEICRSNSVLHICSIYLKITESLSLLLFPSLYIHIFVHTIYGTIQDVRVAMTLSKLRTDNAICIYVQESTYFVRCSGSSMNLLVLYSFRTLYLSKQVFCSLILQNVQSRNNKFMSCSQYLLELNKFCLYTSY